MTKTTHLEYMSLALSLAERGRFTVSPNPLVGCVIVKDGHVLGQGFHQKAGGHHAEVYALQEAGESTPGATVYTTLEPCCHYGKTPPCTQALIAAGVKKVYVACLDPNPQVAGKGIEALRAAGIEVELGLYEEAAQKLNEIFFYYSQHKRPFVISKWAMSLDGKTITHENDSRQISSRASCQHTHQWRQQVDAILVGANTADRDNPQLTARSTTSLLGQQPIRIILSTQGNISRNLNVFAAELPGKTIVVVTQLPREKFPDHIETLVVPKNNEGHVCLSSLLVMLGKRGITSLLVEGGMTVHESFFKENLVNKICVYLAPVIIGRNEKKQKIEKINFIEMGPDMYVTADYARKENV